MIGQNHPRRGGYGVEGMDAGKAEGSLGGSGQVVGTGQGGIVLRCRWWDQACFMLANSEQDFASLGRVCDRVASYLC